MYVSEDGIQALASVFFTHYFLHFLHTCCHSNRCICAVVTKRAVHQKPNSSQDRSGSTAEPFGSVKKDDTTYETVDLGDAAGEIVEMQPSSAYRGNSRIYVAVATDRKQITVLLYFVCTK